MTKYQPNFNDKRVASRVKKAIGFTVACMSTTEPKEWYTRQIDKHFGIQSNPLSKYLREKLLIVHDDSYSKDEGKCKSYLINTAGLDFLLKKIYSDEKTSNSVLQVDIHDLAMDWVKDSYKKQLETLDFEYTEKSHRLWNPIQNIKTQYRERILSDYGLSYHYDIDTAAPTLLYQYSTQIELKLDSRGQYLQGPNDEYLRTLEEYFQDKASIRNRIAIEAEITPKQVKQIINAMFAGAKLSTYPQSSLFLLVDSDKATMLFLQQHPFLMGLKEDIKTIWDYIKPVMNRTHITDKNGKRRLKAISSSDKWSIYFRQERRVLNAIRAYLNSKNMNYFLEHDGWACDQEINLAELSEFVYQKTKFSLSFSGYRLDTEK